MKLPFFRSSKPATTAKTLISVPPPTPRTATPSHLAKTTPLDIIEDRASQPVRPPRLITPTPAPATADGDANACWISLPVASILSQLPSQLFVDGAQPLLAAATISLSTERVVPQLAGGKVTIALSELISLLPAELLRKNAAASAGRQTVLLPLADIVAALPVSQLSVNNETAVEIDSEEFDTIPGLFDADALEADATAATAAVEQPTVSEKPSVQPAIEPQPETEPETVATAPVAAPAPLRTEQQPWPSPAPARPDAPRQVSVRLRNLVALMPDRVFACSRADLWRATDLDSTVPLPVEPMLPQLATGRVSLPLAIVIKAMPQSLFVSPLPPVANEVLPVPLDEIIPQLPAELFGGPAGQLPCDQPEDAVLDIPDPFAERRPQPVNASATELSPVTEPPAEPLEAVAAPPAEILEDDSFNIFTERTAAAAPAAAAVPLTPEVAPEPDPVVSEIEPVAPAAETVAAVEPETPTAPVAEPVAPAASSALEAEGFVVDLNGCSAEELMRIEGVGPTLARRIVEYRNAHGRFRSLQDLRRVPGVGRKTFRALTGTPPRKLNRLLGVAHDNELSLQEIVNLTGAQPGLQGCILAMADGMCLTGKLPGGLDVETVSAFAPQLFKKVGRYVRELGVGQVRRFTLFTDSQPLTIFQAGAVYMIVIHDRKRYSKTALQRCERISREIARMCRQRAVV
jgi:competence ComEA-like helix-hairpin-helix protein